MAIALARMRQSGAVWALYALGLLPGAVEFWLGASGQLGADPVKTFERFLGLWAVRFLVAVLLVTPLRDLAGINLLRYRRALGLLAFYYALAHFATYLILDQSLSIDAVVADVLKRPFITLGMLGLVLLVPLAATSNRYAIRRLGPGWSRLHRLVYGVAVLGALHFSMATKVIGAAQAAYIAALVLLVAYRAVRRRLPGLIRARQTGPLSRAGSIRGTEAPSHPRSGSRRAGNAP